MMHTAPRARKRHDALPGWSRPRGPLEHSSNEETEMATRAEVEAAYRWALELNSSCDELNGHAKALAYEIDRLTGLLSQANRAASPGDVEADLAAAELAVGPAAAGLRSAVALIPYIDLAGQVIDRLAVEIARLAKDGPRELICNPNDKPGDLPGTGIDEEGSA